ncbi:MAG: hypothetical protein U0R44_00550 [Candidatus Micrarchaeia archaeon]
MAEMDYDELRGRYEHVYVQSGRLFENECRSIEAALEASFSCYFSLRKDRMDERAQFLAAFFYRNCVYLSATYHMIRNGMLDPAGNNMRTVFETIIWLYAYHSDDGIYANFRQLNDLDAEKFRLIKSGGWSHTKERKLENLRRKYSFQKTMKKLYSKEAFEKLFFNQYWVLCQKSHSSIFGVNHNTPNMEGTTTLEKRPDEMKDNLTATAYLAVENITSLLNCLSGHLPQERIDRLLDVINRVNRTIPPAPGLAPDTLELEFTVRFRKV